MHMNQFSHDKPIEYGAKRANFVCVWSVFFFGFVSVL